MIFKEFSVTQTKILFLEGESPTLITGYKFLSETALKGNFDSLH